MATNHLHPFATGAGANTRTQAQWEAILATPGGGVVGSGFVDGVADAALMNTVLRQVSVVATALGQFVVDVAGANVNDDGSPANFEAGFRQALANLYLPLNALSGYVQQSAFVGGNQLIQQNGYQIIPGGWTIMWGVHTNSSDDEVVAFPVSFNTACFVVLPAINGSNGGSSVNVQASNLTRGNFTLHAQAQERSVFWIAIGH